MHSIDYYKLSADRHCGLAKTSGLSPFVATEYEKVGGATTLVVVDMQQHCLANFGDKAQLIIDKVIEQVLHARAMGWSIVLLEVKPWRFGRTIRQIVDLLEGKYSKFAHRSKQTESGARELIEVCWERHFGMSLFRFTGVYLEACVLSTAADLVQMDDSVLVRLIKEACATDAVSDDAWATVLAWIGNSDRAVVSSENIDREKTFFAH